MKSNRSRERSTATRRGQAVWLVAAIALASLNLRPAVVAIGPLAETLRADTGLNTVAIGLLTTLPVVCFGVFALAGPRLARRLGLEQAVLAALVLLVCGIAMRLLSPIAALFLGSAIAGIGIALGNVLLPAVVKRHFAERSGPTMAVYAVALNAGVALSAGLTVPLRVALHVGWRPALAAWGVLALAAVLVWAPRARTGASESRHQDQTYPVWRSSLAWAAAGFIGLQSLVVYTLTAWLPTLLHAKGMSEARAGLMLSLLAFVGIAGALPVPVLAAKRERQHELAAVVVCAFLLGLLGLVVAPVSLAVLWMVFLGVGQGAGISLALTLFVLRSRTPEGATQLSAMAQTVGYLLAATGPLLAGALHDLAHSWSVPILFLIVVLAPLMWAGWLVGAARTLEDELRPIEDHKPHEHLSTRRPN